MTGIKCIACRRVGGGGLPISKAITANTLATAARPIAATVGSNPRTAIFVNGKLKLNTRTPRPASTSPMPVDRIDGSLVSQAQFEPGIAAEWSVGEVGEGESAPLIEVHDVSPCRRCFENNSLDGPPPRGRDKFLDQQLAEAGTTLITGDRHPDDLGTTIVAADDGAGADDPVFVRGHQHHPIGACAAEVVEITIQRRIDRAPVLDEAVQD